MRVAFSLIACVACGRIDFDPFGGDGGGGTGRTVSFGETDTATYTGVTTDCHVDSATPTFNFGASAQIYSSSTQVALLRFELVVLPPGTHVLAAELHLHVGNNAADTGTATFYRLLESFDEGMETGAGGIANWTERTATAAWATPGAGAPGSRDTLSLASFAPAMTLTPYVVPFSSEGVAAIYGWIDDPSSNHGFAIVSTADDWKFDASTATTLADRPELVLRVSP